MVKFMVVTANLENLTNLQSDNGCDNTFFPYLFKVRCGRCQEVSEREVSIWLDLAAKEHSKKRDRNHSMKKKGKRDRNHLEKRCNFYGMLGTIKMVSGKGKRLTLEDSEIGNFAPLMLFDCNGYEPKGFIVDEGWIPDSVAGMKFEDINLSAGDFHEYDEKGKCPVMISNLHFKFEVVRSE